MSRGVKVALTFATLLACNSGSDADAQIDGPLLEAQSHELCTHYEECWPVSNSLGWESPAECHAEQPSISINVARSDRCEDPETIHTFLECITAVDCANLRATVLGLDGASARCTDEYAAVEQAGCLPI